MKHPAQTLFDYLRDILYDPDRAHLDLEELDEVHQPLGKGMLYLSSTLNELRKLIQALSRGYLNTVELPSGNELFAPLKALHANLRHLTWQSQQVAKGDYRQRVDFMGDFSDAFNEMTRQLEQRQNALEEEIRISRDKTAALQQSNYLLTEIAFNIPQLLFVISLKEGELVFANKAARETLYHEPTFFTQLLAHVGSPSEGKEEFFENVDFTCRVNNRTLSFTVQSYRIYWKNQSAQAYTLSDVSEEKLRRKELETYAYHDNLTKLYNRLYGMRILHQWIDEKRRFVLCFADLDNLKFINDTYGHAEGDNYILLASRELSFFSESAGACRIGGDEFLLLIPSINEAQAIIRMDEIRGSIQDLLKTEGKPYYSNVSYGAVEASPDGCLTASDLMSLADERMYKNKRENKKRRQQSPERE